MGALPMVCGWGGGVMGVSEYAVVGRVWVV